MNIGKSGHLATRTSFARSPLRTRTPSGTFTDASSLTVPLQGGAIASAAACVIARDAFIYGYPMVECYRQMFSYFADRSDPAFKAPWNQIVHEDPVCTAADTMRGTPTPETAWSYVGLDLRAEPLVLTMPAVDDGRYHSAQLIDLYSHNFAYLGSRVTGQAGGRFLLASPRWVGVKPPAIKAAICSETDLALVRYRTQCFGAHDIDNVKRIQAGYLVEPLSSFLRKPPREQAPPVQLMPPPCKSAGCTSLEFFGVLSFLFRFCPVHPMDRARRARFGFLGLRSDTLFDPNALSPDLRVAIEQGMVNAWHASTATSREVADGTLSRGELHGSRSSFRASYLNRMAGALDEMFGDSPEEQMSWTTYVDSIGERIDTERNRYRLRMEPGQLAHAALWSITVYELPSQRLSPNPRDRYAITSMMLPVLQRDPDGGLSIDIQRDAPDVSCDANWLPAPRGRVRVDVRLYAPAPELRDRWCAPRLERRDR